MTRLLVNGVAVTVLFELGGHRRDRAAEPPVCVQSTCLELLFRVVFRVCCLFRACVDATVLALCGVCCNHRPTASKNSVAVRGNSLLL